MCLVCVFFFFFFFKQKTAYEIMPSLVGSEMCIRDSDREGRAPEVEAAAVNRSEVYELPYHRHEGLGRPAPEPRGPECVVKLGLLRKAGRNKRTFDLDPCP